MAGGRTAAAYGNGKVCEGASAANESGKIVGERVFGAGNAGAGDEIEEAGRNGRDFCQPFIGGSGRAEKNRVEMMRGEDTAIVGGFFGSEVGREDTVGACFAGGAREFLEAHLQDGIVVTEKHERGLGGCADATNEIDYAGERGAGFEGALGGALNGGAVGERIAEGDAEFDDVGAGFGKCEDELQRGVERRIPGGNVGDDAELAFRSEFGEALTDSSRVGSNVGHFDFKTPRR